MNDHIPVPQAPAPIPSGLRWLRAIFIVYAVLIILGFISTIAVVVSPVKMDISSFNFLLEISDGIISLAVSILLIKTINRPNLKGYKVVRYLMVFEIILSLASFTFGRGSTVGAVIQVAGAAILLLVVWYLSKARAYFEYGKIDKENTEIRSADKKFKILFVLFLVAAILTSIGVGIFNGIKGVKAALEFQETFKIKTMDESVIYCKGQGPELSDICLLQLILYTKDIAKKPVNIEVCLELSKEFSVGCYGYLDRCDLVTDPRYKEACESISKEYSENNASTTNLTIPK